MGHHTISGHLCVSAEPSAISSANLLCQAWQQGDYTTKGLAEGALGTEPAVHAQKTPRS